VLLFRKTREDLAFVVSGRTATVFRWLSVLCILTLVTGLMVMGVIPSAALGLARVLFGAYAALLAITAVLGLLRG